MVKGAFPEQLKIVGRKRFGKQNASASMMNPQHLRGVQKCSNNAQICGSCLFLEHLCLQVGIIWQADHDGSVVNNSNSCWHVRLSSAYEA